MPGESTNFLVAGMLPETTYEMRHVLNDGTTSAPLTFTTGALPTDLTFPSFNVDQAAAPGTAAGQNVILHMGGLIPPGSTAVINTVATDLEGNVVWYYDSTGKDFPNLATSLVPGGTVLMLTWGASPTEFREVDLAGDTLRETNEDAVNAQLVARGTTRPRASITTPFACPTATRRSSPTPGGPSTSTGRPPNTSATWSLSWTGTSR